MPLLPTESSKPRTVVNFQRRRKDAQMLLVLGNRTRNLSSPLSNNCGSSLCSCGVDQLALSIGTSIQEHVFGKSLLHVFRSAFRIGLRMHCVDSGNVWIPEFCTCAIRLAMSIFERLAERIATTVCTKEQRERMKLNLNGCSGLSVCLFVINITTSELLAFETRSDGIRRHFRSEDRPTMSIIYLNCWHPGGGGTR